MAAEPVVPICYVNGKRYELPEGRAEATLLQWLRGSSPTQQFKSNLSGVISYTILCLARAILDVLPVLVNVNVCNFAGCRNSLDRDQAWLCGGWLWRLHSHGVTPSRIQACAPLCQCMLVPSVCNRRHACGHCRG